MSDQNQNVQPNGFVVTPEIYAALPPEEKAKFPPQLRAILESSSGIPPQAPAHNPAPAAGVEPSAIQPQTVEEFIAAEQAKYAALDYKGQLAKRLADRAVTKRGILDFHKIDIFWSTDDWPALLAGFLFGCVVVGGGVYLFCRKSS